LLLFFFDQKSKRFSQIKKFLWTEDEKRVKNSSHPIDYTNTQLCTAKAALYRDEHTTTNREKE